MNQTLTKLFPEKETYEEKIYEFLQCFQRNGTVYRRTAEELGINHITVKSILESVKSTDVYRKWYGEVEKYVRGFESKAFAGTIFLEYRSELARIEQLINESLSKPTERNKLLQLKHQLLRDQLHAAMFFAKLRNDKDDDDFDVDSTVYDLVLKEAKEKKLELRSG